MISSLMAMMSYHLKGKLPGKPTKPQQFSMLMRNRFLFCLVTDILGLFLLQLKLVLSEYYSAILPTGNGQFSYHPMEVK